MTARTYGKRRYVGIIVHDQALQRGKSLETCKHVKATYQHFCEGLEWHETEYTRLYQKKYKNKQRRRNIGRNFRDFCEQKLEKYDDIFKDMQRHGYRKSDSIENNVEIALGTGGEAFLIDGRHRLILAKILGITTIPVVANLICESMARSFIDNAAFLDNQLTNGTVQDRLNQLELVQGGFRNKGVLVSPEKKIDAFNAIDSHNNAKND